MISRILRKKSIYTVACDNDVWSTEINKEYVDYYAYSEAEDLLFEDKSFDLVFSCGLLEHLGPCLAQKSIDEMKRVGHKVVVMFPSCNWLWKLMWRMRRVPDGNIPKIDFIEMKRKTIKLFGLFNYIIYESCSCKPTLAECCSGSNT